MDNVIQNYKNGKYLLVEWKAFNAEIKYPQSAMIERIHNALKNSGDTGYSGYIFVRLSDSNPHDSVIFLSGNLLINDVWRKYTDKQITESQLTNMLKLDWS